MASRSTLGIETLFAATVVGVTGNLMLRQTPWGLNAFVFVAVFVAAMFVITKRHRPELINIKTIALQAAMVFFATMFLIRDSIELRVYDTLAIIVLLGIIALSNFGIDQRIAGVFHYIAGIFWSGVCSIFAPFALLGADIDWKGLPGNGLSRGVFSVLRGVAIALPLLLIFGGLFMAADAAFEDFANRAINFEVDVVVSHVMLTAFLAWLAAGYYRGALVDNFGHAKEKMTTLGLKPEVADTAHGSDADIDASLPNNATAFDHINISDPPDSEQKPADDAANPAEPAAKPRDWQNWDNTALPPVFTLGRVETIIILGTINALFVTFVIFQLPYLFGGFELVQNTPDLKLADFARRGFGELVAVSFLSLPLLLASHWLLRRDERGGETIFRLFAGIQVVMLFVIMTSAMQRLTLLTGELGYGWTTVRFYPMVVMIWLAAVFIWFSWTVLRGRRNNFAWGALWLAITTLGLTNLMNPDAFIASKNLELMKHGREFDAYYNANLSDDAVPTLIESLGDMSPDDQCSTREVLYYRLIDARNEADLRSLNLSRERSYKLLERNSGLLMENAYCGGNLKKYDRSIYPE